MCGVIFDTLFANQINNVRTSGILMLGVAFVFGERDTQKEGIRYFNVRSCI